MSGTDRKLVVLGIPWDVDTEGLREYMSKYGELDDVIVMRDRATGRSRGFGYATFSSAEDAKDQGSKGHRGIGFITFDNSDSVDRLMSETHELGGSTIAVDRATPKEETTRQWGKSVPGGYGAYNAYMSAATRYAALGSTTLYDHPSPGFRGDFGSSGMGSGYGSGNSWPPHGPGSMIGGSPLGVSDRHAGYGSGGLSGPLRGMGKKIFVGRLPQEATSEDLRQYFSNFGRILDVYVPKDSKRTGHRGFGFVTFAEDGVADRISRRSHQILGHEVLCSEYLAFNRTLL